MIVELMRQGMALEDAGMALYGSGETHFAVNDERGGRHEPLEGLLEGPVRGCRRN